MKFVFGQRETGTYLTCPIFFASHSHWEQSSVTGCLILIKVQRGKEGMTHIRYQKDIGSTASCNKRMTEATKGIGQKCRKGETKDCSFL